MRGKDKVLETVPQDTGITPAYAGKRVRWLVLLDSCQDHPRVCGEKCFIVLLYADSLGSPPRMRGKGSKRNRRTRKRGITPAYAGKSSACPPMPFLCRDHPRVCGEKKKPLTIRTGVVGSPPRMRGKGFLSISALNVAGITPAYAGKRLKRSRSTVSPVAIVPLFPSVCNKPVVSDGSPAVRDAPLFLPAENAVPASPACNLRSL